MPKPNDSVAVTSMNYDTMVPRWRLVNSLLGGTEAMRAAGETYLPKHRAEGDEDYARRLKGTTLLNMTQQTQAQLVGAVFSEPLQPNDDVPGNITALLDNVDGQGNDMAVFAQDWFADGIGKGFSHVLVDFPEALLDQDGNPVNLTLADERVQQRRPYWSNIPPENVIFARSEIIAGVEQLVHVRIAESEIVADGFGEAVINRIRVLEPGAWATYRQLDNRDEWALEARGTTSLPFIPLVTFYTNREGLHLAKPPLLDLANLNVSHWQSSSDQRNVLSVARFPMLAISGSGMSDEGDITVGPYHFIRTSDPQAKAYYVEHSGKAIQAGREDLADLENQMAGYGAEFLKRKPGSQTATARALDTAESRSELESYAARFKDALETVLMVTAAWLGGEDGGTVSMAMDLAETFAPEGDLNALTEARKASEITQVTYLTELQRRGVLSEDLDVEEEIAATEEEKNAAMERAASMMATMGGDDDDEDDEDAGRDSGGGPEDPDPELDDE